jgi:hypothetical protein
MWGGDMTVVTAASCISAYVELPGLCHTALAVVQCAARIAQPALYAAHANGASLLFLTAGRVLLLLLQGDALYAMELALSLEKLNFQKLRELHDIASDANDAQMCDFIEGTLLAPQVRKLQGCSVLLVLPAH